MKAKEDLELIEYRLKKARIDLKMAKSNLGDPEFANGVTNRLYYACFHAVSALLVQEKVDIKSHKGVKSAFSELFIKTKRIETQYSKMFSQLFELRQKGDYTDHTDLEMDNISPYVEQVEQFIDAIERILKENTEG